MSALPPYDLAHVEEKIQALQQSQGAGSDDKSTNDLISLLKQNQFSGFSDEINNTVAKTLILQQTFVKFSGHLVALEDASPSTDHSISESFTKMQKVYDNLLWAGRELATSAAGANCIGGFVNMLVPDLILNHEIPREDLVLEIENFIQDIPVETAVVDYGQDWPTLTKGLQDVKDTIQGICIAAQTGQGKIQSAISRVQKAEVDLERATDTMKRFISAYLGYMGIDSTLPSTVLVLAFAIDSVIRCLTEGRFAFYRDRGELLQVKASVKYFKDERADAIRELERLTSANGDAHYLSVEWTARWTQLGDLIDDLTNVEPSFNILTRISEAIRQDCQLYLAFLKSADSEDTDQQRLAEEKMESAAKIYKELILTLKNFASRVALN